MKIKLDAGAILPTRAHKYDAGLDLYAPCDWSVPGCTMDAFAVDDDGPISYSVCIGQATIDTGVHVQIPEGFVGMIKSKSGLNVKHGLTADGVIDSGYTGSIAVKLYNHTADPFQFRAGDKIAQLVIMPVWFPTLDITDDLEETERGDGGFGSTGR